MFPASVSCVFFHPVDAASPARQESSQIGSSSKATDTRVPEPVFSFLEPETLSKVPGDVTDYRSPQLYLLPRYRRTVVVVVVVVVVVSVGGGKATAGCF